MGLCQYKELMCYEDLHHDGAREHSNTERSMQNGWILGLLKMGFLIRRLYHVRT